MKTKSVRVLSLLLAVFALVGRAAETNQLARLVALCRSSGAGSIEATNYHDQYLIVGRQYTMLAKPNSGWVFTNWTDGYGLVITNQPRVAFVMKTNLVLFANFVRHTLPLDDHESAGLTQLPLKVLAAIEAAPADQRPDLLARWMRTVAGMRRGALPSVVSTVVTAHPELLAAAVSVAVTASPSQTYGIVYAAAQTPGANLETIVTAACSASPMLVYQVVQALLDVNPRAGRAVLARVAATIPALTAVISSRLSGVPGNITKNQALEILMGGLSSIDWPINPAPPNQNPYDYSQP